MSKELVISAASHERRVAILEEGQLVEIYIEREKEFALVGSIYKGRVTRVLPGMQSAFVDIGLDGDAFLYVSDVFENLEDYDHGHGPAEALSPATPLPAAALTEVLPGESLAVHRQPHILEEAAVDAPAAESSRSEADSQDSQQAEVDEQGVSPVIEAHSEMAASEVSGAHPDEAEE